MKDISVLDGVPRSAHNHDVAKVRHDLRCRSHHSHLLLLLVLSFSCASASNYIY
ncbi:hypothetical protein E2C01_102121 [Portunus trituberculatus]|uniref:Uncharacterized protein n=1 Tax=Portunus trituberculatus TaxID=210409 RepID=A0A5B7KHL6_PORTR|nr:hypothetical protein [Portunus trituberculatus]